MSQPDVIYSSANSLNPIRGGVRLMQELFKKRQLFVVLVLTMLRKRYKGSYLGVFWTMLNPLMTMLGLALIFPLIIKFQMDSYVIYLFSGIVAWGLISTSVIGGGDAILANQGFIKKVYIPKLIFPIVQVTAELVNTIVTVIVLHVIAILFDYQINTNFLYLIMAILVTYFFGVAIASLTSVLAVYFRDLKYMLGVVMQTVFYLSAIIFPITLLPEKYRLLMEFNVFYQYVRLFHESIYFGATSNWSYFITPITVVVVLLILVVLLHQRVDRQMVYRI